MHLHLRGFQKYLVLFMIFLPRPLWSVFLLEMEFLRVEACRLFSFQNFPAEARKLLTFQASGTLHVTEERCLLFR